MQFNRALRIVALLLVLVILATSLPLSAFAAEEKSAEVIVMNFGDKP